MLLRLFRPVKPFDPVYSPAWCKQLEAIIMLNGVTTQTVMHALLLNAIPVELLHLAVASTSNQRPYDNLCAAVPACYGDAYYPPRWSGRKQPVSPSSRQAVPASPLPSLY
ncbi:hypothetical protein HPB52_013717 [Rhipicephalus sanguineus]|uniref:Uncharacterized protein n=1 Tax=Rhipicephalus sanguineus TaxID=34632 RepID=A0A9D4PLK0_RHISA|nr:hypothetical protein HPB52_013717 [Rhipicephalus sanguineus]